ncbi:MAG: hypothetical protein QGG14_08550, partial [Planctomycetota bacterium]|nr:hypothetical protein [Planctomycetota bacterium]
MPRSTDPRTPEQPEQRLPIEEFTDTVDSTEAVTELPALDVFPKKLAKADRARLLGTLEALLFASTEALTPARLA